MEQIFPRKPCANRFVVAYSLYPVLEEGAEYLQFFLLKSPRQVCNKLKGSDGPSSVRNV